MFRYFMFAAVSLCLFCVSGCGDGGNTVSAPPAELLTMEERQKQEEDMRAAEAKYDGGE